MPVQPYPKNLELNSVFPAPLFAAFYTRGQRCSFRPSNRPLISSNLCLETAIPVSSVIMYSPLIRFVNFPATDVVAFSPQFSLCSKLTHKIVIMCRWQFFSYNLLNKKPYYSKFPYILSVVLLSCFICHDKIFQCIQDRNNNRMYFGYGRKRLRFFPADQKKKRKATTRHDGANIQP